jgi:ABC-type nitrate/sulfonate/bicarbonate transport system ATPase subunit
MRAAGSTGKPLRISGLAKTYGTRSGETLPALGPVSVDVEAGEFLVVVGPSGCGKTTLLHLLAGFLKPTEGGILVGGEPIAGPSVDRSVVFQSYALFPWLSVLDNVQFGLRRKEIPRQERREIALYYLRLVGLQDFADKDVDELSGGMKQRVAIARAFAVNPSILLMDEPFGALDALTRRLLQRELLRIWQEQQRTVVFITHSVTEAMFLADRIVLLSSRPGRIKGEWRVAMPRPRDTTAEPLVRLEREIYALLDEELAKTFAQEGRARHE